MKTTKMFRMTIDMPAEEHLRLKTLSSIRGISMKDLILDSVREKINSPSSGYLQTLRAIENVKNKENLVECKDVEDLFRQLGI